MMTPERPRRTPYPLLLDTLTYTERDVLYAALSSGWAKQRAVHPPKSPISADTSEILSDVNRAPENAAAYREAATAACRTCGANGLEAELEKITARAVGGGRTRSEWLCADHAACTARKFHQLADTLAALAAGQAPDGSTRP